MMMAISIGSNVQRKGGMMRGYSDLKITGTKEDLLNMAPSKPKRRNGRLKWKQRALDAEAELEDAAIWRWIWVSLGVVVGSVGTPIVFYLLTGQ